MARTNSLGSPCALLTLSDPSGIGEARRSCRDLARALGFDETGAGKVAIVASEIASNVVRHGRGGHLVTRAARDGDGAVLELLALDRGPGMRDVARCMTDGFSTAGTPGTGLGAVRRLADAFDLYTVPDQGTALLARFRHHAAPPAVAELEVGALSLPYPGETACGDAWTLCLGPDRSTIAVIDGLGHGPDAAAAARAAVEVLNHNAPRTVEEILDAAHGALRPTRGAAMAVARITSGRVAFAGVGNIVGTTAGGETQRRMVSLDGTVGHEAPRFRAFEYALEPGRLLVMHSDGLRSHWQIDRYPGLAARDPLLIAGVLYRDWCRGNDDVTVVVGRRAGAAA